MKKMKRVLTLTVAVTMLLSAALTGCGNKATTSDTTTTTVAASTSSTQAEETKATLPEVKLSMYFGGGAWPQADQDLVFGKVNEELKSKINTTIDFKPLGWGDYNQKMQVVITSGEDYDMCFTAPWINNYAQNVAKGAFLPLDDLLPKYAPVRWEALKNYWDAARIKGKIYGFINEQIFARTAAVTAEKELADKYNFDATYKVGDLSSLEPYIAATFKENPDKYVSVGFSDVPELFNMEYIGGVSNIGAVLLDDQSTKVFNLFDHPNFVTYVNLMRDWSKKGYLHSTEQLAKKSGDLSDQNLHKYILSIGGAYKPGIEQDMLAGAGYASIARPAGTPVLTTSGVIATMIGINRNSKNPERAVMFLELINTDTKTYNLLNFGIEGTHYKLEDGFMVKDNNDENHKKYNPSVPWELATNFLAIPQKGSPVTIWEDTKKLNETAQKSVLFGFTFDSEPVKGEVGKCSAVVTEYQRSIELGLLTEAKYPQFIAKLKAAGSDTIIAEMQKQIDEWKATKK